MIKAVRDHERWSASKWEDEYPELDQDFLSRQLCKGNSFENSLPLDVARTVLDWRVEHQIYLHGGWKKRLEELFTVNETQYYVLCYYSTGWADKKRHAPDLVFAHYVDGND